MGGVLKNTDLAGKYSAKLTFSPNKINDHTVTMVILPVALCFKHRKNWTILKNTTYREI